MMLMTKFKSFFDHDKGAIAIIAGIALPVVMVSVGLAVDFNRYLDVKSIIRSAADNAALSAVAIDPPGEANVAKAEREASALRFFNANLPQYVKNVTTIQSLTATQTFPSGGPLSMQVHVQAKMKNAFGSFVGVSTSNVNHIGVAVRKVEKIEAVLTLSSSGTMCSHKSRTQVMQNGVPGDVLISLTPDANCEHWNAMKIGVQAFMQIMSDNYTISDFKVGFVPYNFKVRMPKINTAVPSASVLPPSLVNSEPVSLDPLRTFYVDMTDAEPLSGVVSFDNNMSTAALALSNMTAPVNGAAWTRTNVAAHVAGLMLDPSHNGYFLHAGGAQPKPFNDAQTQKVIIMMTDGSNTGCCFTNHPVGNFNQQYVYLYGPDNTEQIATCDALKTAGVRIFTIVFDVEDTDPGGPQINNVFARCASGAYSGSQNPNDTADMLECKHKQGCYNVKNNNELVAAYKDIAQSFYRPRLSK